MISRIRATLVALLIASVAFPSFARADGSVMLYGLIDSGLTYVSNQAGHSTWLMQSGVNQNNRWGLRGQEDIGGGMKTIFVLENGFDSMTGNLGQAGREFGRQAWVGLSTRYGSLTMGRQYDPVVDFVTPLSGVASFGSYGAHFGDLDNLLDTFRVDRSIKYRSATVAGFSFEGLYSLGGTAGDFAQNRVWSVGAGYTYGGLTLGAGYIRIDDPLTAVYDGRGTLDSAIIGKVPLQSAQRLDTAAAGASYSAGAATVGLVYTRVKFRQSDAVAGDATWQNVEVNGRYQLAPTLQLAAMYTYTRGKIDSTGSTPKYHQADIGIDYFLSKRTDLYLFGVYQKAAGDAEHAQIVSLAAAGGATQVAVHAGIRHRF